MFDCNLRQKYVDKFTKSSKTVFFAIFYLKKVKMWLLGDRLSTSHQIQAFQGFSKNFLIFQNPKS